MADKTFLGTVPSVDNTNTFTQPTGATVPSNLDFEGTARNGQELVDQIDALIVKAVANTFTVEDNAQWTNLMRQLGTVIQNTGIEGFRGKANGTATPQAGSIAANLVVTFNK